VVTLVNARRIQGVSGRALTSESAVAGPDLNTPSAVDPLQEERRALRAEETAVSPPTDLWFRRRIKLRTAFSDVWRFRELIHSLAERDYRARYKQAVLGIAWAMLTPLALMVVFTFVFARLQHFDTGGAPYVLFSYIGLLPWTFFSGSVSGGGQSIVGNMSIVNKVACPREVFPLASIATVTLDTLISSAVLLLLFGITGFAPKPETLYAPIPILVLLVYTIGMTLLVSALLVYFRDLRQILPLAIQLGLFITPVAYGIEVIAHTHKTQMIYSLLNPVAPVIDSLRRTVLYGLAPDWQLLGMGAIGALIALVGGYVVFKRLEVGFADIA
jgi:ABC-2 type transport system permease protein/lipopolysaccharide transport system permease protein